MAYTKAQQQRFYSQALGFAQGFGAGATEQEIVDHMMRGIPEPNRTEERQLSVIAGRALESLDLASRFRDRPEYKPRSTSYPTLRAAYAGEEGYEYRVVVRLTGIGADEQVRGLFVVRSESPLGGIDVQARALEMARSLARGDPYFARFRGHGDSPNIQADIVAATRLVM